MLHLPFDVIRDKLFEVLIRHGLSEAKAGRLAEIFTENSLEGSYSHGVNRFPRFIDFIRAGTVDKDGEPERIASLGGLEVIDGHLGPGPLNAEAAMERAIELARACGIGCVALRNTTHWMRPGRYGQQAARAGMAGICWTNTIANMPAWGAKDPHLGNCPIVFAVPREAGDVVVDMSMSQFAYGKLEIAVQNGERLPIPGGFDRDGRLTDDPVEITETRRILPTGYWKGSALSLVLDMIASGVSGGKAVFQLGADPVHEVGVSQMFLAINFRALVDEKEADRKFDQIVEDLLASVPAEEGARMRYPGQRAMLSRAENLVRGIPLNEATWNKICSM